MKLYRRIAISLAVFLAIFCMGGASAMAASPAQGSLAADIFTRMNLTRNDVWQAAGQLGFDVGRLRKVVGKETASVFDQRLWPLERSQVLDGLANVLNAQGLAEGNFTVLSEARRNPAGHAEAVGYSPAEIDIVYAAAGYQTIVDPATVSQELLRNILHAEFSRLERGEESLLFKDETRDVGVAFSGQQLIIDGKFYYTYIVTVIPARAQPIYPIVAAQWLVNGLYAGRPELPVFDARYYLEANPDLLTAMGRDYQAARAHWQQFGMHEGRAGSPAFYAWYYLEANPDLKAFWRKNFPAAIAHWLLYGMHEGRPSSPSFHVTGYLKDNPDLLQAFGLDYPAAVWHYLTWGRFEGR